LSGLILPCRRRPCAGSRARAHGPVRGAGAGAAARGGRDIARGRPPRRPDDQGGGGPKSAAPASGSDPGPGTCRAYFSPRSSALCPDLARSSLILAWAAATRAVGTRKGEQLT